MPPLTKPMTFEEVVNALGYFTDEQRSLAWSPEPPFESLGAGDGRAGGSPGFDIGGETARGRWIRARVRWNKEQRKLGGAA
jgi:hypothetical protein